MYRTTDTAAADNRFCSPVSQPPWSGRTFVDHPDVADARFQLSAAGATSAAGDEGDRLKHGIEVDAQPNTS